MCRSGIRHLLRLAPSVGTLHTGPPAAATLLRDGGRRRPALSQQLVHPGGDGRGHGEAAAGEGGRVLRAGQPERAPCLRHVARTPPGRDGHKAPNPHPAHVASVRRLGGPHGLGDAAAAAVRTQTVSSLREQQSHGDDVVRRWRWASMRALTRRSLQGLARAQSERAVAFSVALPLARHDAERGRAQTALLAGPHLCSDEG